MVGKDCDDGGGGGGGGPFDGGGVSVFTIIYVFW